MTIKLTRLLFLMCLPLALGACALSRPQQPAVSVAALAGVATSVDSCRETLSLASEPGLPGLDPASLSLLIWNIQKAADSDWLTDLANFSDTVDLVLLQEAVISSRAEFGGIFADQTAVAFAPGFGRRDLQSGVATISGKHIEAQCHLRNFEPWLSTPKATVVTRFALDTMDSSLLVVNTHMINFTMGVRAYGKQLGDIESIIQDHTGPLIVAGDFNTWNAGRDGLLRSFAERRQLLSASFDDDYRSRFMGYPLDHVFVSGLQFDEAIAPRVTSSDHNPLLVRLRIQDD